MNYHILNGDALVDRFIATGIPGEMIVCREALVDGPLSGNNNEEFFEQRSNYLSESPGDKEFYAENVKTEFEKIINLPATAEVYLWFGYDLFCRANMFFILSLLHANDNKKVFVVHPSYLPDHERWKDFGGATPGDLITCFNQKIQLRENDIEFGNKCWNAFKKNDLTAFEKLVTENRDSFPWLAEVGMAHIERFAKNNELAGPEKIILEIMQQTGKDRFETVCVEFWKRAGIYGFGDTQIKKSYDKVIASM